MASLRFHIADIPEEGLEITQQVMRGELFLDESDPATQNDFTVSACLNVADADVMVQGELVGTLRLDCVRCLSQFDKPFRMPFEGVFLAGENGLSLAPNSPQQASDAPADELEVYGIEDECVALGEMLREQVILSVPMQPLCASDCKGLCNQCGENLNVKECSCSHMDTVSPFSVLRNLVKSSESSPSS